MSKFLSVLAQKKADKLAAQASELAFYNVLLCTGMFRLSILSVDLELT